jgi:hypothetical protein
MSTCNHVSREYWENPDDPSDNGWVWICNWCGEYGPLANETAELTHQCTEAALAEKDKWDKHYEDWPTDEDMKECESWLN